MENKLKQLIYFDYAATTPVAPEVFFAMQPYFAERYGNPGSLHSFGQIAMAAVDKGRESIAKALGADFRQIIFTGSATEANNLALRGVITRAKERGVTQPHVIVSNIEHESILQTAEALEQEGVSVTYLPVDHEGKVSLVGLQSALRRETVLVSIMYANNEIGTVEPILEIAGIIQSFRSASKGLYPLFHTDAVQAFQFLECKPRALGVDLMTLSAHKIYGPKGIGLLYISDLDLVGPILTGGGQEFGLRSGTENVSSIVGFSTAVKKAIDLRAVERERLENIRSYLYNRLTALSPAIQINGPIDPAFRLPHILNVYLPNKPAADLLVLWDLAGLAASLGSACSARAPKPSHVLSALGLDNTRLSHSLRFSLGRMTMQEEIDNALEIIKMSFLK